ncbi:polyprenyl synthetase family protein [Microbacterium album]|uniref:Geranylgeranyl pyrophosphate synthase n=1 Tax=Microbacterium album TaxID=2053191 RepID=A0A917ML50_9MICO|nr:polyprenyl synthetase family protein [Microbacterium album]GGH40443.1 geranylgeranyl pyrophosphate synthase [Microbacterium album]
MQPAYPVIEAISQRLESFAAQRREEATPLGPEAELLAGHAVATLRGGKRLRARFCWWGWRAVAGAVDAHDGAHHDADERAAIGVCAALEIFQAAALVHDDLIDNSDTRRGRPSAHRALEADHREQGWSGRADAFGRAGSLLLGDLLVAWSDDLLEESLALVGDAPQAERRDRDRVAAARAEYARMRRDVTMGQFLDIAEESAWSVAPDDAHAERALRIASYKSARYSVQQPLVIGAALAGGRERHLEALRSFGHPLGMAFQLRDDVLGVFGDAAVTGKPAGDDLREGKRTALVALARPRLARSDRERFDELLGAPDLSDADVGGLRAMIQESGALDEVERLIASYARDADEALAAADLAPDVSEQLRELARAATHRRS